MNVKAARQILSDVLNQQEELSKEAILLAIKIAVDNLEEKEVQHTLGISVSENIGITEQLS